MKTYIITIFLLIVSACGSGEDVSIDGGTVVDGGRSDGGKNCTVHGETCGASAFCVNVARPGTPVSLACVTTICGPSVPRGTACTSNDIIHAMGVCDGVGKTCVGCGGPYEPIKICPYWE